MKVKGEIYNDEIEEQNYYETYLMEIGDELRKDRYYYAKHAFVDGYFDPVGIDHDGVMYWELSPDSFVEIYNEIKENNKDSIPFMSVIVPRVEKAIQEHKEFLLKKIDILLTKRFSLISTAEDDKKKIKKELLDSVPTMDEKEELIEKLELENEIYELLVEKFILEHIPEEQKQTIISETLSQATSTRKIEEIILTLRIHNNTKKRVLGQNNE